MQQQKMGANPMMPGMGMPGMGGPMGGAGGMGQPDPNQKRKEMFKNMVENLSLV